MLNNFSFSFIEEVLVNIFPTHIKMVPMEFSEADNRLIDDYFVFIKDLVRSAGELVKTGYSKSNDDMEIVEKVAKWDMVTEYDRKTEDYLKHEISRKYPDHK